MDPSLKMQMDVRNNAAVLTDYAKELKDWETEMKQKDKFLQKPIKNEDLPPVRSKHQKREKPAVQKTARSYATDYSSWNKYDAEKACEDIEKSESDSSDEEEKIKMAEDLKKLGNSFVAKENWDKAIKCYSKAIATYDGDAIYYANRALCYIKKEIWALAEKDCCSALELNVNYVKALQRRAVARAAVGKMSDALGDLTRVLELEPKNTQAKEHIKELRQKMSASLTQNNTNAISAKRNKIETADPVRVESNVDVTKMNVAHDQTAMKTNPECVPQQWITDCDGDGRAIVKPIIKAPHQRSKKPLRRIIVEEIDPSAAMKRSINTLTHVPGVEDVGIKKSEESMADDTQRIKQVEEIEEKKLDERPQSNDFKIKEDKVCANTTTTRVATPIKLEMPKTAMHFYNSWKQLKGDTDRRFEFLKIIPGESFPKLFGTSLESSILSEILHVLKEKFITNGTPVLSYLQGIKDVPRFTALKMFMSETDKSILKEILSFAEKSGEVGRNELENLMTTYDLKI